MESRRRSGVNRHLYRYFGCNALVHLRSMWICSKKRGESKVPPKLLCFRKPLHFMPLDFETLWSIGFLAIASDIVSQLNDVTGEERSSAFLRWSLTVAFQRVMLLQFWVPCRKPLAFVKVVFWPKFQSAVVSLRLRNGNKVHDAFSWSLLCELQKCRLSAPTLKVQLVMKRFGFWTNQCSQCFSLLRFCTLLRVYQNQQLYKKSLFSYGLFVDLQQCATLYFLATNISLKRRDYLRRKENKTGWCHSRFEI